MSMIPTVPQTRLSEGKQVGQIEKTASPICDTSPLTPDGKITIIKIEKYE